LIVPAVSRHDPLAIGDVLATRLLAPFSSDAAGNFHLLGTDRFGRDLFVRMMLAGRISLLVGIGGSLLVQASVRSSARLPDGAADSLIARRWR